MHYTLDVNSIAPFNGNANIVQLINASRAVSAPYGGHQSTTDGQFWLDNTPFYINGINRVSPPWPPYAHLDFIDQPGLSAKSHNGSGSLFDRGLIQDYVVFKPDGDGNIYVTLGHVFWNWSASTSKTDGVR